MLLKDSGHDVIGKYCDKTLADDGYLSSFITYHDGGKKLLSAFAGLHVFALVWLSAFFTYSSHWYRRSTHELS